MADANFTKAATGGRGGVAAYLAAVQFLFALGWVVYVIFLPDLLVRAGIDKSWTPWVLALDQLVFVAADLGMGVAMDRARAAYRRIGGWLAATVALSSVAMLAMPFGSALGAPLFLTLTLIWVATSAALRAPPYVLMSRHAATSSVPALAGLMLFGMALAAAAAPYLALVLKGVDPALPFALVSLAIVAANAGIVVAERTLNALPDDVAEPGPPLPLASMAAALLILGLFCAALGFQWQTAINAAAQVKRVADASWLPYLLPVFWAGFAFGLLPAGTLGHRLGNARTAALAGIGGALALGVAAGATTPTVLGLAHFAAGGAWALAMCAGIGIAAASGRRGAEGRYTSIFFALLAAGTLTRIAFNLGGVPQALAAGADWAPVALWAATGILFLQFARQPRPPSPSKP